MSIVLLYCFSAMYVHVLSSTWESNVNLTILRNYSGTGRACASSRYRAVFLLPRGLGTRLFPPLANNTQSKHWVYSYLCGEHVWSPDNGKLPRPDTMQYITSDSWFQHPFHLYIYDDHSKQAVATLSCVVNLYVPLILANYYTIIKCSEPACATYS